MVISWVLLGVLWYTAIFAVFQIESWKSARKWRLPGPRAYPFGGIINFFEAIDRKTAVKTFLKWCQTYGPVFQLSCSVLPTVVLNSPEYIQKLYGSSDVNYLSKPFLFDIVKPVLMNGLMLAKGSQWKARRKVLSHIVDFKSMQNWINIFNKESYRLVHILEKEFDNCETHKEILHYLYASSLNTITEATFGACFSEEEPQRTQLFIKDVKRYKEVVCERMSRPWSLLYPLSKYHPLSVENDILVNKILACVYETIKNYRDSGYTVSNENNNHCKGRCLMEELLEAGLSDDGVAEEVTNMIGGGYETTGTALHFVLFLLALHPEHQEICREEVDSLLDDNNTCPNGIIDRQALSNLKHLERCILETLRMHPASHLLMRKLEAPLTLEENLILPSGTIVFVPPYAIHMNPSYYPNPHVFNPDRFLPDEIASRNPYTYLAFSGGPRKCVAYRFAIFEIMVICARILRNFVITTDNKHEDITLLAMLTIAPDPPVSFHFQKRNFQCNQTSCG